jgi:hypothetical protein
MFFCHKKGDLVIADVIGKETFLGMQNYWRLVLSNSNSTKHEINHAK